MSNLRSSKSFQEDNREEVEEAGGLERVSAIFFGIHLGCTYFLDREMGPLGILSSSFHSLFPLAARLPSCQPELKTVG